MEFDDRIPPQALDMEQALLGSLIIEPKRCDDVIGLVTEQDFYRATHGSLFGIIMRLWQKEEPVDLLTIQAALQQADLFDALGGAAYLIELTEAVPSVTGVLHYASMVTEMAQRRACIDAARRVIVAAHDRELPVADVLGSMDALASSDVALRADPCTDIGTAIEEAADLALERAETGGRGAYGVAVGLGPIDACTFGLQPATLSVVAARPGMGKSALALHMAIAAAKAGVHVGFFTAEMSKAQLTRRIAGNLVGCNHSLFITGKFSHEEFQRIAPAVEAARHMPITLVEATGMKPSGIRAIARRKKMGLVIADYLQLLEPEYKDRSREVQVSNITTGLKGVATRLGIPVIALSQLNREGVGEPSLVNLRESDAIGNTADLALFLWRKPDDVADDEKRLLRWKIDKNRHGRTAFGELWFYAAQNRFVVCDDQYE